MVDSIVVRFPDMGRKAEPTQAQGPKPTRRALLYTLKQFRLATLDIERCLAFIEAGNEAEGVEALVAAHDRLAPLLGYE